MIYAKFELITREGKVMVIMGGSMMKWTSSIFAPRQGAVIEEDEKHRAWH